MEKETELTESTGNTEAGTESETQVSESQVSESPEDEQIVEAEVSTKTEDSNPIAKFFENIINFFKGLFN